MKNASLPLAVLLLALLVTGMDLGGGFYEHTLVYPRWSADPPASFVWIQGDRGGIELVRFWIPIHVALTLALLLALALNWRDRPRRRLILAAFGSYLVMRIWTFAYFIPEITAFMQTAPDGPPSAELTERARRWGTLSHGRTVFVAVTALCLLWAAFKGEDAGDSSQRGLRSTT